MGLTGLLQSDGEIYMSVYRRDKEQSNVQSFGTLVDSYRASEG